MNMSGYASRPDVDLERLAAGGDRDAFAELYNRHFDRVYDFSLRLLRDADEAADVAQETFLKAMAALRLKEKRAAFTTWLLTIARNTALNRLRARRGTVAAPSIEQTGQPEAAYRQIDANRLANPEEALEAKELAGLVWQAAAALDPKQYSLLDLHLRQGLDSGEIATMLGTSKNNAYVMLSRLRASVEESITAFIMARRGRRECAGLNELLEGRRAVSFNADMKRAVARHIEGCSTCQEQRKKLVSPTAIFGALAAVPVPLGLKQQAMAKILGQWTALAGSEAAKAGGFLSHLFHPLRSATGGAKQAAWFAGWKATALVASAILVTAGAGGGVLVYSGALGGGGGGEQSVGQGRGSGGLSPTPTTPATLTPVPGNTDGVTDTEIKIGTLLPMSGSPAANFGIGISRGMKAYFDYVNDNGGIYGRRINFIIADNQYSGPVASEVVRKLVEQDKVFAIQGSLGAEAEAAVHQYLEQAGVPDMFILRGDSKWTAPVARNRFGFVIDPITEGRILGKYIADNYNGKRLGILAQNGDFGKEGEQGLRQGLKDQNATMDIVSEYYDEAQADVSGQAQRLKDANVDVIAFYGSFLQDASLVKARETLKWNVPIIVNSVSRERIFGCSNCVVLAKLAGYENIEGAVSVVYTHQASETNIPGVAKHIQIMARYAPDVEPSNLTLTGATISEAMVHILEMAGPDLTRDSFLDAAESMCNWTCSACLTPASLSPTDHALIESEVYVRATGTTADTFKWEPFGQPVSLESTKECTVPTPPPGFENQPR